MFEALCGVILFVGLVLNALDRRMLLLTVLVGVGFFLPAPNDSYNSFFIFVIYVDTIIGLAAMFLAARGSVLVAELSVLLVIAHCMGYALDGSLPFSPYHVLVKILEVAQIGACVAFSPILAPVLRNHDATTT
jgi:hypothetical protein